jgi:hypothetical protein
MFDLSKYVYIRIEEASWSTKSVFIKAKHIEGKEGLFITCGSKLLDGLYFITTEEIKISPISHEPKLGNDRGYSVPLSRCEMLRPPSSSRVREVMDSDSKLFSGGMVHKK